MIAFCVTVARVRAALCLAALVTLASCSSTGKPSPEDLGANVALLGVKPVWVNALGDSGLSLEPRAVGSNIFAASSDGTVASIDARTGADVWRAKLDVGLSSGVGTDGKYVAVASRENEVIVIDGGRELWRQKLSGVTLTAPLVAGSRVFVSGTDRSVVAFDAKSGRRLWQQQRSSESLVLGQPGLLFAVNDLLIVGIGGRLQGLNPNTGNVRWDVPIANGRGTNEIERVVDLVAGISRVSDEVCVRSFQSAIACVNVLQGGLRWTRPAIGSTGLSGDAFALYGTESDGKVVSTRRADGERLWVSERLRFRKLSTPVVLGRSLVVGDETGVLHFLSVTDGSPLNRISTDSTPIEVAPLLVDQTLVALTRRGGVYGFRPE